MAEIALTDGPQKTATARELILALMSMEDLDRPVIVADNAKGFYLNLVGLTQADDGDNFAAVIEVSDDFDTRQF